MAYVLYSGGYCFQYGIFNNLEDALERAEQINKSWTDEGFLAEYYKDCKWKWKKHINKYGDVRYTYETRDCKYSKCSALGYCVKEIEIGG